MSIKKYFDNDLSFKILSNKSDHDIAKEVESADYHAARIKKVKRFIPNIDFADPNNFAKFGSAKRYYTDAVTYVYRTYPYDGSLREKVEWENSASYVDLYVFDNRYPRTNGFINMGYAGRGGGASIDTVNLSLGSGSHGGASTVGWANHADKEYILIKGGPNQNPHAAGSNLASAFTGSNVYDPLNRRNSNLDFDLSGSGATIEFWMKKDGFDAATINKDTQEVVFDLWNNHPSGTATGNPGGYGRCTLELYNSGSEPFRLTVQSGGVGTTFATIGFSSSYAITSGSWTHYAFAMKNFASDLEVKFYVNGELNERHRFQGNAINPVTGAMIATIGALVTSVSGASPGDMRGWGKFSGSLDEFRYWKTQRTSEQIGKYWFTQVGGGSNLEDANVDLGVYYKFNEGITEDSGIDLKILDYSGRVSNGTWVRDATYDSGIRDTGSAIVRSAAATREFLDPIIYREHPSVAALTEELYLSGAYHDDVNVSSLYKTFPTWMIEEDQDRSGEGLLDLTQIIASYFDTLNLQIQELPKLKNIEYPSASLKPLPFSNRLLESAGFIAPEIFIDADLIERLDSRSKKRVYEEDIDDIKNIIYKNIYNNLVHIYKSKGTEKAFRNLIRCFGVDDELIKINVYGNYVTHEILNNFRDIIVRKKYINFNTPGNLKATVYQYADPDNPSSTSFISGSTNLTGGYAFTTEAEVIFPKKIPEGQDGYVQYTALSASLFGMHNAEDREIDTVPPATDRADTTWPEYDFGNFQVYAARDEKDSDNVRFILTSSLGLNQRTYRGSGSVFGHPHEGRDQMISDLYEDVYDNTKWNFAVRVRPNKYPQVNLIRGTTASAHIPAGAGRDTAGLDSSYIIEFYGVQNDAGVLRNEFLITSSIDTSTGFAPVLSFLTGSKRIYAGAHRLNFTGSVLERTDVKIGSVRHWLTYLTNNEIKAHARDVDNVGVENPYRNAYQFQEAGHDTSISAPPWTLQIPRIETLVLNWDFNQVTASDDGGQFFVIDASSGSHGNRESTELKDRYGSWLSGILSTQHPASGAFFATSSTTVVDRAFILSARQNLPENLSSEDMIKVLSFEDDLTFTRDSRPIENFFAFEKSMYQTISEEMLNLFASINDFNNLIGEPVNRYRLKYKGLEKLRQLFFRRVKNERIDLEKYIEFYKWFDSSLSKMLLELVPASADFSDGIRNMVESHILERSKYHNKFPTLEMKDPNIAGVVETLLPASPGWKFTHAPVDEDESKNIHWWRTRAERHLGVLGSKYGGLPAAIGAGINDTRRAIFKASGETNEDCGFYTVKKGPKIVLVPQCIDSKRNKCIRFSMDTGYTEETITSRPPLAYLNGPREVHGGVNYNLNKRRDVVYNATYPLGPFASGTNVPSNILITFDTDVVRVPKEDEMLPNKKLKVGLGAWIGRHYGGDDYARGPGELYAPYNLMSSSVTTGYNKEVIDKLRPYIEVSNLHNDDYGSIHEIPMQGPFTEKYVGGRQHRHTTLNIFNANKNGLNNIDSGRDRAEGWKILFDVEVGAARPAPAHGKLGALAFVDPQYPDAWPAGPGFSSSRGPYYIDRPKAHMYRSDLIKRPVNIRNIQQKTGSLTYVGTIMGNYTKNYEVVQSTGRWLNDPFHRDSSFPFGAYPETLATQTRLPMGRLEQDTLPTGEAFTNFFSGNVDAIFNYEIPARTGSTSQKTIIVNRFSAPGGFEVMSHGFLDPAHEEYSVYNALPFRNLSVRGSGSGDSYQNEGDSNKALSASTMAVIDQLGRRRGLRTLLSLHCGQFGADGTYGRVISTDVGYGSTVIGHQSPDYVQEPSYHKVNRNRRFRLEHSNQFSDHHQDASPAAIITGSRYDNYWVNHPIPQSDRQYGWVTASALASQHLAGHKTSTPYGYQQPSGVSGIATDIIVISASEAGSYIRTDGQSAIPARVWGANSYANTGFYPTDFIGLNHHVYEPITSSENHLGWPVDYKVLHFANESHGPVQGGVDHHVGGWQTYLNFGAFLHTSSFPAEVAIPAARQQGGGTYGIEDGGGNTIKALAFNALMLNRNGPYGYPSWKQIRTREHPVVRYQRKKNILSARTDPPELIAHFWSPIAQAMAGTVNHGLNGNSFVQYTEQPICSRYRPFTADLGSHKLKYTFGNYLSYFSNETLNNRLALVKETENAEMYGRAKNLILDEEYAGLFDDITVVYSERIYPKEVNVYQPRVRGRQEFNINFWKGTREKRNETDHRFMFFTSSQEIAHASGKTIQILSLTHSVHSLYGFESMWPLDGRLNPSSSVVSPGYAGSGGEGGHHLTGGSGVLQNFYTTFCLPDAAARKTLEDTGERLLLSYGPVSGEAHQGNSGGSLEQFGACSPLYCRRILVHPTGTGMSTAEENLPEIEHVNYPSGVYIAGDTIWETAQQAGKNPFTSYEDYIGDLRLVGKDYSIVPEFRISEHMEYFIENGFLSNRDSIFEITGAGADIENSSKADFFKVYGHSDFMKYFEVVENDYENKPVVLDAGNGNETSSTIKKSRIALRCGAVLKFLPYRDFYPVMRTLELARLFNKDYIQPAGSLMSKLDGSSALSVRPFTTPFFGPGILYNTIKSGIAVDYPVCVNHPPATGSSNDGTTHGATGKYPGETYYLSGSQKSEQFAGKLQMQRIPFEALFQPSAFCNAQTISGSFIYDAEPHPSSSLRKSPTSADAWEKDTTNKSRIIHRGTPGSLYPLAVQQFMAETLNFFMKEDQSKPLLTTFLSKPESQFGTVQSGSVYSMRVRLIRPSLPVAAITDKALPGEYPNHYVDENFFNMYDRPSAFGPAVAAFTADVGKGNFTYQPFTPPYYDGVGDLIIRYQPEITGRPSIADIFSNAYIHYERSTPFDSWPAWAAGYVQGDNGYDAPAYENAMHLSASVDAFEIITVPTELGTDNHWLIGTKFETPILNFNHDVSVTLPSGSIVSSYDLDPNTYNQHYRTVSKGMWHQYGSIATGSAGVFLSIIDDASMVDPNTQQPVVAKSLASIVGFTSGEAKRIGEVKEKKIISEALVAVPFAVDSMGRRKFFDITRSQINQALLPPGQAGPSNAGITIRNMVSLMQKYYFPPKMDFITNLSINPFAMYIFEFTAELSQQDLVDIWQGLPPSLFGGDRMFAKKEAVIEHELLANEFFGSNAGGEGVGCNLQWLVFKVKRKAAKNYFKLREASRTHVSVGSSEQYETDSDKSVIAPRPLKKKNAADSKE